MDYLIETREAVLRFYARYSVFVDRGIQFVVSLMIFVFISSNIGFMKAATNPVVTLGLAVVCAFIPASLTAFVAAIVIVIQFYALSPGIALVAAVIFAIMFVLYFRFTPERAIILLVTPIAFSLKIPMLIPIVYGLTGVPLCVIPIAFGTIVCYMITYVKAYETTMKGVGASEIMTQVISFTQQVFNNKDMWVTVIAMIVTLLVVYSVRRLSVDYAWKIAIVSGALVNLTVLVIGKMLVNVEISYVSVIIGTIVSMVLALVLEFFVFAVDYSRTERLQFEDDEYVYYVKAVPKVSVAEPEKTVKRINERQATTSFDSKEIEEALQKELETQNLFSDDLKF